MTLSRRTFIATLAAAPAAPGSLDFSRLVPARTPRSAIYQQEGWCL
jgi:hypothetical protein